MHSQTAGARALKQLNPWGNVVAVIVPGATAHEVTIDDAWFVDENPAADFQIETAFRNGGHAASFNAAGESGNLHAVADTRDWLVDFEEITRDAYKIFVVANIFRSPSAGKKKSQRTLPHRHH